MLDDSIGGINYRAIHVKKYARKSMSLWWSRESRVLLGRRHAGLL